MADIKQIKNIFNQVLELEPLQREDYLARVCGTDFLLREEVDSLLNAFDRVEDFLQTPAAGVSASEVSVELLDSRAELAAGSRVGAYEIEKIIGRGGMGTVYLAERGDGQFKKRVAIKLLRHLVKTDEVIRRFEKERQILADLEHPFIARLLDGGATEDGSPYFVMEYVEGLPVDRYCEEHNLPIEKRLELFCEICAAVQFAHEHSVIHRDIKPKNILVSTDGMPKLLDFGIAKVLRRVRMVNTNETTLTGFRVMTPDYASPEQMRGKTITAATDIYSLGLLLYKLLTGQRPYNLNGKSPYEIVQAICEQEPLPPSEVMRHAKTSYSEKSTKSLKGDLDDILLKSLRKEPERRYESVEEFSADIRRYLAGMPIKARKDTFAYRAVKYVRRNQSFAFTTLLIAALFLIIGFALSSLNGSSNARDEHLNPDNFGISAPNPALEKRKGGTANAEARDLYLQAQAFWEQRTHSSLKSAADLFQQAIEKDSEFALPHSGLSNTYFLLGVWGYSPQKEIFPKAKVSALKAIELAPDAAEGHLSLAMIHWLYEYDWQAADSKFNKALELNPTYARVPHWYGLFLAEMGRFDEAVAAEKRALEIEPGSTPVNADLARVLFYARRYDEALEQYRRTVEISPKDPGLVGFHGELCQFYDVTGMIDDWFEICAGADRSKISALSTAYQAGGSNELKRKWIELYAADNFWQAGTKAQLGENDRAIELLHKSFEARTHQMAQIKVHPWFDNLRSDPRFQELLKKMNLKD